MKWRHCAFSSFSSPSSSLLQIGFVHSPLACFVRNLHHRNEYGAQGENSRQMCRENKLQNTKRWAAEGRKRVQLATLTKWNRKFDCGQRWVVSLSIAFPYHYEYICIYSPTSSYIHTYLPQLAVRLNGLCVTPLTGHRGVFLAEVSAGQTK